MVRVGPGRDPLFFVWQKRMSGMNDSKRKRIA